MMRRNEIPARSEDPAPTPKFVKNACPNNGKPAPSAERNKAEPARIEAAYFEYDSAKYLSAGRETIRQFLSVPLESSRRVR